jgi:hypothetical protein
MFYSLLKDTLNVAKSKARVDTEEILQLKRQIISIHKRLKTLKSEPAIAKYQAMLKQAFEVLKELEARQGNRVAEGLGKDTRAISKNKLIHLLKIAVANSNDRREYALMTQAKEMFGDNWADDAYEYAALHNQNLNSDTFLDANNEEMQELAGRLGIKHSDYSSTSGVAEGGRLDMSSPEEKAARKAYIKAHGHPPPLTPDSVVAKYNPENDKKMRDYYLRRKGIPQDKLDKMKEDGVAEALDKDGNPTPVTKGHFADKKYTDKGLPKPYPALKNTSTGKVRAHPNDPDQGVAEAGPGDINRLEHRGEEYNVYFNQRKGMYTARGKGQMSGQIQPEWFHTLADAMDHAEMEIGGYDEHDGVAADTYKDTSGTFKDRLVGEILNFYSMHGRIPRISEYSPAVRSKLNSLDFDERSKLHRQANVRALKLAGKQGNLSKLGLDEGEDDLYEQGVAEGELTAYQKLLKQMRQNAKNDPYRIPRGYELTAHGELVKKHKTEKSNDGVGGLGEGVTKAAKQKTPGVALSKAYRKDFDGKKPGHDRPETALTGAYSKTGKPGGALKKAGVGESILTANTPDPIVVVQDRKGNILDTVNLSAAVQKYRLGNAQNIKNQLAHQNYTTIGNYVVMAPMGGQPQDKTTQGVAENTNYWHKLQAERNTRINSLITELKESIK